MSSLTQSINAYFAILCITVIGALASLSLIHVANAAEDFLAQGELGQAYVFLHETP